MGLHQGFQLADPHLAHPEHGLGEVLAGGGVELSEPVHLGLEEGLEREVGEGRAPPQGQSGAEGLPGPGRVSLLQPRSALGDRRLEADGVNGAGLDSEQVTR